MNHNENNKHQLIDIKIQINNNEYFKMPINIDKPLIIMHINNKEH